MSASKLRGGHVLGLVAALCLGMIGANAVEAGDGYLIAQSDTDLTRPKRHFKVERPAELSGADALSVYDQILDEMVRGYQVSGLPEGSAFRGWRHYNRWPFRSATHGERFVNHYGNAKAEPYGKYEKAGAMPPGAVLAKDSFTVTARGDVFPGPLFLMEKMPAGFNGDTGDWKYTMIMPDGSVFGVTNGEHGDRVGFCANCHRTVRSKDYLFFPPKKLRMKFVQVKPQS